MSSRSSADIFHAIADPNRRRILDLLRDGERSVKEIVGHFSVTVGAISQHLQILYRNGLVSRRKVGRFQYYRSTPEGLKEVHDWTENYRRFWQSRLDALGEHLDEDE